MSDQLMSDQLMQLIIGDWSGDGHGRCDRVLVTVNHTAAGIRAAYDIARSATGVCLSDFAALYESGYTASDHMISVLKKYGYTIPQDIDDPIEEMVKLYFWFVGLVLKDIKYTIVKPKVINIHGDHRIDLGYGLY